MGSWWGRYVKQTVSWKQECCYICTIVTDIDLFFFLFFIVGRLGHVANTDVGEPKFIESLIDEKIIATAIAIGANNCGIIASTGQVYLWGANNCKFNLYRLFEINRCEQLLCFIHCTYSHNF